MTNKKNNKLNIKLYFIICVTFMILLDFFFTGYILNNISAVSDNFKFVDIVYAQNTGAAFSSFQHSIILLIFVSILAMLFLVYELLIKSVRYTPVFYFFSSMLFAGIFCNTFERVTLGYVRDFISLRFITFPVFNISDVLINFSVLAIMYLIIKKKYLKND